MTLYNFHDTLAALCKNVFVLDQKEEHDGREDRILKQKEAGMAMSRWDKMKENSPSFWKLTDTQREQFLEKLQADFNFISSRVENKGLDADTPIAKVMEMKEKRISCAKPFKTKMDEYHDPDGNT